MGFAANARTAKIAENTNSNLDARRRGERDEMSEQGHDKGVRGRGVHDVAQEHRDGRRKEWGGSPSSPPRDRFTGKTPVAPLHRELFSFLRSENGKVASVPNRRGIGFPAQVPNGGRRKCPG